MGATPYPGQADLDAAFALADVEFVFGDQYTVRGFLDEVDRTLLSQQDGVPSALVGKLFSAEVLTKALGDYGLNLASGGTVQLRREGASTFTTYTIYPVLHDTPYVDGAITRLWLVRQ